MQSRERGILEGVTVIERSQGVAAAYAGRLLAVLGATVIIVEEPDRPSSLRELEPMASNNPAVSALFSYLAVNKKSVTCNLGSSTGRQLLDKLLSTADILIDDTPVAERQALGLDPTIVGKRHKQLIFLSVLPFGAHGIYRNYSASETNLFHAGGEGYLMPNGLALEMFPNRAPVKVYGHFSEFVGGNSAVVASLAALFARDMAGGQFVDVSIQDANVALSAFSIQCYGDGVLERRDTRSFRYGGVIKCQDGYIEVLTLEQRQWEALVELMASPVWATEEGLQDPLERAKLGPEINERIRAWAKEQKVEHLVSEGQRLGVPIAKYCSPAEVFSAPQPRARGLFPTVEVAGLGPIEMFSAPFLLSGKPPQLHGTVGEAGSDNDNIWCDLLGHSREQVASWRASGVL